MVARTRRDAAEARAALHRRRRDRRAADRRLVAARQRPDLRRRRRRGARARRALRLQRLGREVHAVRQGRGDRRRARRARSATEVVDAPLVLEGGSIARRRRRARCVTTEQCLLHPSRNPALTRDEIEAAPARLPRRRARRLARPRPGRGPRHRRPRRPDRGVHRPGRAAAAAAPPEATPTTSAMAEQPRAAREPPASTCIDFPHLPRIEVAGEDGRLRLHELLRRQRRAWSSRWPAPSSDAEALARDRRRVSRAARSSASPARRIAYGGGGPHCITQQVPAGAAERIPPERSAAAPRIDEDVVDAPARRALRA